MRKGLVSSYQCFKAGQSRYLLKFKIYVIFY